MADGTEYDANGNLIYADTEKLDHDTFWAYGQELKRVIDELKAEVAACLPIAKEVRDKSDAELNKSAESQCKFIMFLLGELKNLSAGNADQVAFLSKVLKDVEEINTQVANFGGTKS